jgi:hypothetical protein
MSIPWGGTFIVSKSSKAQQDQTINVTRQFKTGKMVKEVAVVMNMTASAVYKMIERHPDIRKIYLKVHYKGIEGHIKASAMEMENPVGPRTPPKDVSPPQ